MSDAITAATGLVCAHCGGVIGGQAFLREREPVELACCSQKCAEQRDPTNLTHGYLRNLFAVYKPVGGGGAERQGGVLSTRSRAASPSL